MSERYEIKGKLGKGGMSAVYHAVDTVMGREVAIKRLLPLEETNLNEEAGDVLASEAAALAQFQHPNVVTVFAFEEDQEGPFVVMELVDGIDLFQVLQDGALSVEDFIDVAEQCLEPLVNASELSLLHRDIKPANIMLTMTEAGRFVVKILDFGLAKFSQQPSTQTLDQSGSFLGSIDFIAPEQLELRPLDQRTDLYSLGCVLYFSLAQRAPFSGKSPAETSMNHLNHKVVPILELRPDLPEPLANWLMRMMSRDPDRRPHNALAALEAFRRAKNGEPEPSGPVILTAGAKKAGISEGPKLVVELPEDPEIDLSAPDSIESFDFSTDSSPVTTGVGEARPEDPDAESGDSAEDVPAAPAPNWQEKKAKLIEHSKHPAAVATIGLVALGILIYFLFGRR